MAIFNIFFKLFIYFIGFFIWSIGLFLVINGSISFSYWIIGVVIHTFIVGMISDDNDNLPPYNVPPGYW